MDDFIDYLVCLGITAVVVAAMAGMVFLCSFLFLYSKVLSIAVGFILFNAILFGSMKFLDWYA